MKKFFYVLLFSPIIGFTQAPEDLVFEISTLRASSANSAVVESAMGAHNKKYHASGPSGVRVYNVVTGTNSGDYKWVMGPAPWSALDTRPDDEVHNMDWGGNVARYLEDDQNTEYIRFDPKLSRFPKDFNVSKLHVMYIDVARGKMDKVKEILGKTNKVYAEKIPGETYGIYYNSLPSTSNGRDLVIVSFFDKYAWMGIDDGFDAKYEEMYGKGSTATMRNEWRESTISQETEIWEYNEELSGLTAAVKASERQ